MRAHKTHKSAVLLVLALVLGMQPLGCADTSTTQVRTSERRSDPGVGANSGSSQSSVEESRTTVVQKDPDDCEGVLSCTVNFVGEAVALPFRLVGGVLRAIF